MPSLGGEVKLCQMTNEGQGPALLLGEVGRGQQVQRQGGQ